ncbi:hypothetical protein INT47_006925 [Mucor saturninus]|uniref:Uncharacterized protein n=1 Tax=Mucor saturninus TaxID=64648 RepID=A0A8H7QSJ9_9FUNG|nr:hypothetical protein INT47_006925 [Mucor saturninus]
MDVSSTTHSRTSQRSGTSSETFSLVGTHGSEKDCKGGGGGGTILKKLGKPSKSETTKTTATTSSGLPVSYVRHPSNSQPFLRTRKKTSTEREVKIEEEENNELERLSNKLRTTFLDVIECKKDCKDEEVVDLIKSQLDAQTVRIRRLERALREKEDQLIQGDSQHTISLLLTRYPQSMELYKTQVQNDQFNLQLESCIDQFESQKQRMMEEHQRNFEVLKMKYRTRFDDIVERMISDPSRLDDEWARRVQQDADNRVEEMRKRFLKRR